MTIDRALLFSILMAAIATAGAGPALAQACTREGDAVTCDDGRRGLLSGDAIIWPTACDRACRRIRASSSAINAFSSEVEPGSHQENASNQPRFDSIETE